MVKIGLQVKFQLENIEKLCTNQPDFRWFLKIKCTGCNEVSDKWHDISLSETVELKTGHGNTNFACKCKFCGKENQMDILADSVAEYKNDKDGQFQTLVHFDCRGMEPVDFWPRESWTAHAVENGRVFNDVDLSDKEWAEFDDKNSQPVGIYEYECQFNRIK